MTANENLTAMRYLWDVPLNAAVAIWPSTRTAFIYFQF